MEWENISLTPGTELSKWICPIVTQFHGKTLDLPSRLLHNNKILLLQKLRTQYPMPGMAVNELEPIS